MYSKEKEKRKTYIFIRFICDRKYVEKKGKKGIDRNTERWQEA